MYAQKTFREPRHEELINTIGLIGAMSLVTSSPKGLLSTFVPVVIEGPPEKTIVVGHIARANPQWRDTDTSGPAMAIAIGPHGYVSPNWYPTKMTDQRVVPTWNHVHIQAHGRIEFLPDRGDCLEIVTALTDLHESTMAKPWSISDAPSEFIDAKLAGIVGFRLHVTRLEGMFKMSQNQPAENRAGVIGALGNSSELAQVMTSHDPG